jgi:excisionase family DNA binding protein
MPAATGVLWALVDATSRKQAMASSEPLLLSVREAARSLGISRNLCYQLVAEGRLPNVRLGRRVLIPRWGLEQWITQESGLPQPSLPVVTLPQRH